MQKYTNITKCNIFFFTNSIYKTTRKTNEMFFFIKMNDLIYRITQIICTKINKWQQSTKLCFYILITHSAIEIHEACTLMLCKGRVKE